MITSVNPLLPAGYDITYSALSVVVVALMIMALVSVARSAKKLTATQALVWTVLIIFLPVLGPTAWFAIGRQTARPRNSSPGH